MMKRKLAVLVVLQFILMAPFAHADIAMRVSGMDVCKKLPGTWDGEGNVSTLGNSIHCQYAGHATVGEISSYHTFDVNVILNLKSGHCPDKEQFILAGKCDGNVLVLQSKIANLTGSLNNAGNEAGLFGTASVDVPFIGKTMANVNMTLRKSS